MTALTLSQFIAKERERLGSDDAFWVKFSNEDGTRMNYEKILRVLQKERGAYSAKHAADALKFFGNDLTRADTDGAFMYQKTRKDGSGGKEVHVMVKKHDIARRWNELLAADVDVAERTHPDMPPCPCSVSPSSIHRVDLVCCILQPGRFRNVCKS